MMKMTDNVVSILDQELAEAQLDHTVEIVEMQTVHIQKKDWLDWGQTKIIDDITQYLNSPVDI